MEPESNASIERWERQRASEVLQAARGMSRRLEHLRYFYEHILQRSMERSKDSEAKLQTQFDSIRAELEYKNKLLDGSATASDFDRALTTLEANNLTLLRLSANTSRELETRFKDTRRTFELHCSTATAAQEKKLRNLKYFNDHIQRKLMLDNQKQNSLLKSQLASLHTTSSTQIERLTET